MSEQARRRVEHTAPGPPSSRLIYGKCGCEYPCSCVEFEGKQYGSWKEVIDHVVGERDKLKHELTAVNDVINLYGNATMHMALDDAGLLSGGKQ